VKWVNLRLAKVLVNLNKAKAKVYLKVAVWVKVYQSNFNKLLIIKILNFSKNNNRSEIDF